MQVELMVWYCDARKMTFLACYAGEMHDPADAEDALLPAVCHR